MNAAGAATAAAAVAPPAYSRCLNCDYLLDGLDEGRCPECGGTFDAADPRTVRQPGAAGTARVAVRRTGSAMSSTSAMTIWLVLSTWAAAALGTLFLPLP